MNPTTRQRLLVTAILLALSLLIVASGVALALAEGMHFPAALIGTSFVFAALVLLLKTDTGFLVRLLRGLQLFLPISAFGLTTLLMGKTDGTVRAETIAGAIAVAVTAMTGAESAGDEE